MSTYIRQPQGFKSADRKGPQSSLARLLQTLLDIAGFLQMQEGSMTYVMLVWIGLMFVCGWLHIEWGARVFAGVFLVTLLEITITRGVAAGIAGIKQAKGGL